MNEKHDDPKAEINYIENASPGTSPLDDFPGINDIDEKKLMRKIDWVLLPWLSVLYLLSFLDRTAIGNAKTFHMATDLKLTDQQYLLCLTIFFIPYALFEPPSNVLLKKLSPRVWLTSIMVLWGIAMIAQGLVKNFQQLMVVRTLLGIFEAGLFPGVNYYLSCWYKRNEFGLRASIFFSAATVSGAMGGLLAAAISNMNGVGGKPAWAWIFILEGILTVVAALISPFLIQNFPDTATFLNPAERAFVIRRLQTGDIVSAGGEKFHWSSIIASLKDWKTYVGMIIYAGVDGPLYAFSLFTPSIIKELGYTAVKANLISVPVYVFACILTVAVGFSADRTKKRGVYNLICLSAGMAGYIILIVSRKPALSYFAIYLAAAGIYPLIPNTIAWVSNNTEGSYKRSLTMGLVIGFGNLNGAVTSNIYRAKDLPWYKMGHGIVLCYIGLGFTFSALYMFLLSRENKKRDRGERDEHIQGQTVPTDSIGSSSAVKGKGKIYESEDQARAELGDAYSGYRSLCLST
ncbi:Permease of the major facilitator superfamily [Phaffia rhodozyma]|uniref:Permease of the major facilitator superfamily n=1 Tax=Phaffia rhodozyma TaxID=264483 RepID=A0A0F7SR96_PHARH|nr:Permease of the major facilitator superfamily [Phaffia rhodozyma]